MFYYFFTIIKKTDCVKQPVRTALRIQNSFYKPVLGDLLEINETRNNTIAIKNTIFAIAAAPLAIPPNPNMAAIIAITKKITAQRSIYLIFDSINLVEKPCRLIIA